jgi:hypothetical protein
MSKTVVLLNCLCRSAVNLMDVLPPIIQFNVVMNFKDYVDEYSTVNESRKVRCRQHAVPPV